MRRNWGSDWHYITSRNYLYLLETGFSFLPCLKLFYPLGNKTFFLIRHQYIHGFKAIKRTLAVKDSALICTPLLCYAVDIITVNGGSSAEDRNVHVVVSSIFYEVLHLL